MTQARSSRRTSTGRHARRILGPAVSDIDRIRLDAGLSIRAVARAAGIHHGYLAEIIDGSRLPSIAVITAICDALAADLSIRVYPNTGPRIHDRVQAMIVEELLRVTHPSWRRSVEVPVVRPARGVVDIVFDRRPGPVAVCTEVQTRIDRLEQQIRWAHEKADSLPSSDLWSFIGGDPTVSRMLVIRSTRSTRELARRFASTLHTAYPSPARDAYRALTSADAPWPGAAILWVDVRGDAVRILDHAPRGSAAGRP